MHKRTESDLKEQEDYLVKFTKDLRNPLTSMLGNIEIASIEVNQSKSRELMASSKASGEVLMQQLNNIIDSENIDYGRFEIDPKPTQIYDLVEKIWKTCDQLCKTKGLYSRVIIENNVPK